MILFLVLTSLGVAYGTNYKCHGNVMVLTVSGASSSTARQDGLSTGGLQSSYKMADNDYSELNKRKTCYYQAGKNNCIQPAVVAALASRESRGGKLLYRTKGYGDGYHAYGILQCDGGASGLHSKCTQYAWDSCAHIDFMVKTLLVPYINQVKAKHPTWTQDQALKGGISAYNAGVGNVQTYAGMDLGTTGNDYANDVCARAQRLISHYHWDTLPRYEYFQTTESDDRPNPAVMGTPFYVLNLAVLPPRPDPIPQWSPRTISTVFIYQPFPSSRSGGYGNGGSSYGILQCNSKTTSLDCDKYAWDSCQHINFMVHSFLIPRIKAVRQAHPSWTQDQTLQAGISVYNTGVTNVQTVAGVDSSTQGRDFSNDVCARAQRLINHHKWE
ncbi:glycine, glutamate and proline-rich protein [Aplysia californica]|uniref:Glycine, glutamate and proline-rich protein n=1 Tax=Aplysia californica TaxID=6500 RepID=A0ABM1A0M2_APLCA|nr:glycine, glutamate and proline-rich protein [Aplysia californica]